MAAAAFSCMSGRTCEYTSMVTEALECPSISCTTLTGTPSEKSSVAQVVEAYAWETRTPEEGLEVAAYEV